MIAMMDFQATHYLIDGEVPKQAGTDHPNGFPTGVFPTRDGAINIAASGERMWRDFLKVVGAEEIGDDELDLIGLEDALTGLTALDARMARVVELRFFGGLDTREIAHSLGMSPRSVESEWALARAWLHRELKKQG
jgi:hypothetical protein